MPPLVHGDVRTKSILVSMVNIMIFREYASCLPSSQPISNLTTLIATVHPSRSSNKSIFPNPIFGIWG